MGSWATVRRPDHGRTPAIHAPRRPAACWHGGCIACVRHPARAEHDRQRRFGAGVRKDSRSSLNVRNPTEAHPTSDGRRSAPPGQTLRGDARRDPRTPRHGDVPGGDGSGRRRAPRRGQKPMEGQRVFGRPATVGRRRRRERRERPRGRASGGRPQLERRRGGKGRGDAVRLHIPLSGHACERVLRGSFEGCERSRGAAPRPALGHRAIGGRTGAEREKRDQPRDRDHLQDGGARTQEPSRG